MIGRPLCIALALSLAGCATAPAPTIHTRIVDVPTPVRCTPALSAEPAWADTDPALAAAKDDSSWVQLLVEGRLQRIARLSELSAALTACEGGQ